MYSRGHLPDHPAVVARRTGLHTHPAAMRGEFAGLASSLPMATTNRAFLQPDKGGPGNLDQDGVGKCEGMAHASAGTLFLAIQAAKQGIAPLGLISPDQLYLGALIVACPVSPAVVTDTGTMPSSVDAAWIRFGACLAKDDPQYPATQATLYNNPNDPNSSLKLPSIDTLIKDSAFRYKGQYFITSGGPQRVLDALTVLASGRPITDAIPASGPEFQGYSGGVLGALSGPIDHANLIVDYTWTGSASDWQTFCSALRNGDTTTTATLGIYMLWIGDNSWSVNWGEADAISNSPGGMYRASMPYFNQAEDLSVIDIVPA